MTSTERPKKATIIVNRHIVKRNKKQTKDTGILTDDPAISIRTSKGVVYGKTIGIDGSCTLIQDAANARCSGATIWIETILQNLTIDGKKACPSMFPDKRKKLSPQPQPTIEDKQGLAVVDIARKLLDVSGKAADSSGKRVLQGKQYRIEQSPQGLTIATKDRGEILNLTNGKLTSRLTSQDVKHFISVAKNLSRELKQIQSVTTTIQR